jgi:regulatory protein
VPEIVDVRPAGGRSPLAVLVHDDGERLRLHQRRLADSGSRLGAELTADDLAVVERLALADDCEQRALRLLASRSRSTAELARRMEGWGLTGEEASAVVERLERLGVVDDDAFASALSEQLRRRGAGHLRARADLERHGVEGEAARAIAEAHAEGDDQAAGDVVHARFGQPPYDEATVRRAAGLLLRRGFDEDTVRSVLGLPD